MENYALIAQETSLALYVPEETALILLTYFHRTDKAMFLLPISYCCNACREEKMSL